jgi:CRP-like cAMP-binding protein
MTAASTSPPHAAASILPSRFSPEDGLRTSPLIRSLERIGSLSDAERCVLDAAVARTRQVGAGQDIVREGDRPPECGLILDGFACRYKLLSAGRRQIMSFHIAGDICDLHSFLLEEMDHSIGAVTTCTLGVIPHQTLHTITERHPHLTRLLWRSTLIDAAAFREWMAGIGRKSALGRVAHLLCEILVRLEAVGLAQDGVCELPMTQTDIGDALGLTNVHVNRVLQQLRGKEIITSRQTTLVVNDWGRLKQAAEFVPNYLHLQDGQGSEPAR